MSIDIILFICLVALFLITCFTVLGILVYSGLFVDIVVGAGQPPVSRLTVAYKFARGPYKEAGYLFNDTVSVAPKLRCFAVYYDDPHEITPDKQRYIVGSILAEGDEKVDESTKAAFLKHGFKTYQFPSVSNVVKTTFPYTTTISIFIAVARVYPVLGKYIKEKKLCAHPMIELYDGFTIHFLAPLSKQDEFYVPETMEVNEEVPEPDVLSPSETRDGDSGNKNTDNDKGSRKTSPPVQKESPEQSSSKSTQDSGVTSASESLNITESTLPSDLSQMSEFSMYSESSVPSDSFDTTDIGADSARSSTSGSSFEEIRQDEL